MAAGTHKKLVRTMYAGYLPENEHGKARWVHLKHQALPKQCPKLRMYPAALMRISGFEII